MNNFLVTIYVVVGLWAVAQRFNEVPVYEQAPNQQQVVEECKLHPIILK